MNIAYAATAQVVIIVTLAGGIQAQTSRPRVVEARQLEAVSHELVGDSTAWPILVHFGTRDAERNAFVFDAGALASLRSFRTDHIRVRRARNDLRGLIPEGARVFAAQELEQASKLLDRYADAVRSEDPAAAQELAVPIVSAVSKVGTAIEERRTEDIMAALVSKAGDVDKRKGLLGRWNDANVDDTFAPTDAVRTAEESQAGLTFSDGVDVIVGERTTVVIRESRIDKLNQRVRRDVDLVTGSVLAKLTASARDGGDLTMRAGPAESSVRSGKFWVEAAQRREMRLSNYDGSIAVTANNVQVQLEKNQGTIAREGQAPLQPVDLLPPPSLAWGSPDTVIGTDRISVNWDDVGGAGAYVVETAANRNFEGTIERRQVRTAGVPLTGMPLGTRYVRLAAVDVSGLRGIESSIYSITRVEDTQPPAVILETGDASTHVTARDRFVVSGRTERGASISINGVDVPLTADGSFSHPVDLVLSVTSLTIEARDRAGNLTTRELSVQRPDPVLLRRLTWNVPVEGKIVRASGSRLEVRGTAYPGMEIRFGRGPDVQTVRTAPDGRWVISVPEPERGTWTLTMHLLSEETTILTDTYEIQ